MFSWLSTLPLWFQLSFAIISFLGIIFMIGVIIKIIYQAIKLGIKWKSGDDTIEIGSTDSSTKKESKFRKNPHKECMHNKDIILLIHESNKLQYEKLYVIHIEQLRDQMNYAEQKSDEIKYYMLSLYLDLLETKGISSVVGSISTNCYRLLLKDITNEILRDVRQAFRENHFIDMNEISFDKYINDKFEYIKSRTSELLNQNYFYEEVITREELYTYNIKNVERIRELIFQVFMHAKEVAINYRQKERELDEKLQKLLEKYF